MQADAFFSACNAGVATDGSSLLSVCGAELWAGTWAGQWRPLTNRVLAPGHIASRAFVDLASLPSPERQRSRPGSFLLMWFCKLLMSLFLKSYLRVAVPGLACRRHGAGRRSRGGELH